MQIQITMENENGTNEKTTKTNNKPTNKEYLSN
jgi:hypothetical protein